VKKKWDIRNSFFKEEIEAFRPPVSQAAFARMKGVSPARVNQWARDGIITLTSDRKVDVATANQQLVRNLDGLKRQDWELAFPNRERK
jgi:hypothetical protein